MTRRTDPQTMALRALVRGAVQGIGFRQATLARALQLKVMGWVRNEEDGSVVIHAEGAAPAVEELVAFLGVGPPGAAVAEVTTKGTSVEGHEQFAIRGLSAGDFVVREHAAGSHHFDLRLQVGTMMRSWALPKGPSLDPAVRRLALEVKEHSPADNEVEGRSGGGRVIVWDRGAYEQGGRVPWPQALARGHAVFVLHGKKLRGGFALQRTRSGQPAQWLLIKRRDQHACPDSDVVAELPRSVLSGRTLAQLEELG